MNIRFAKHCLGAGVGLVSESVSDRDEFKSVDYSYPAVKCEGKW